jgi:hypothetical protein
MTEQLVRVFWKPRAVRVHLLLDGDALCGLPDPPGGWLGERTEQERRAAAILPLCGRCASIEYGQRRST